MKIFTQIYRRAKLNPKKIALPEGNDQRVIAAASAASKQKLAEIVLIGNQDLIARKAKQQKLDISKVEILNPQTDQRLEQYVQAYWQLRQHKGVTLEQAQELLSQDFVYYAALLLRSGRVDGFVAGACHTTSDVARAALRCIKRQKPYTTASGAFLIQVAKSQYGEQGLFLFADCAIVPNPSPKQLAEIAQTSAELWVKVTGYQPRIAMLSFSSRGSSEAAGVDKVREACAKVKQANPKLMIDGELQADSAIVPSVAKIKVADSPLKGRANILIFPNLDSGNIAYKLMQRLAQARVVGPLIQGLASPLSDLSRGCGSQEIVDAIAVTVVRAQ